MPASDSSFNIHKRIDRVYLWQLLLERSICNGKTQSSLHFWAKARICSNWCSVSHIAYEQLESIIHNNDNRTLYPIFFKISPTIFLNVIEGKTCITKRIFIKIFAFPVIRKFAKSYDIFLKYFSLQNSFLRSREEKDTSEITRHFEPREARGSPGRLTLDAELTEEAIDSGVIMEKSEASEDLARCESILAAGRAHANDDREKSLGLSGRRWCLACTPGLPPLPRPKCRSSKWRLRFLDWRRIAPHNGHDAGWSDMLRAFDSPSPRMHFVKTRHLKRIAWSDIEIRLQDVAPFSLSSSHRLTRSVELNADRITAKEDATDGTLQFVR